MPEVQLLQALLLLLPDLGPDRRLVSTNCGDVGAPGPELLIHEILLALPIHPGDMDGALAFGEADDREAAYLGGIAIIICTWSRIMCPSSILLSFC